MSRTKIRAPARCSTCRAPVAWFLSVSGRWRTFDPKPVNGRTHVGATAFPVEGRHYWRTRELVEDLMVRRHISEPAAQDEVYDLPWHVAHTCPPDGDDT
ncbi:MAG: hypothetical protein JWO46_757 [Nocardioidaceae bacterium]|nr:hypothetical protein [Nocardioidaceae bacterium]